MAHFSALLSSDDIGNKKSHKDIDLTIPQQTRESSALPDNRDSVGNSDVSHHDRGQNNDEEAGGRQSLESTSIAGRINTRSSAAPLPPPDSGFVAWMVVVAGHLVTMWTWGVITSFGAFQTYHTSALNRPPSDISWIGSFQIFLIFFIGTFTGRASDAGLLRPCLVIGITLVALGLFTAAQCTQYWQLFIAQGVCLGLGNGFLFCPTIALNSQYFQKNRGIAIGLGACGSATGGLVFPSIVRQLLPSVGFPWTMRAIGFIQVGCLIVAFIFLKPRVPPRTTGSVADFASFQELDYTCYAIGSFLRMHCTFDVLLGGSEGCQWAMGMGSILRHLSWWHPIIVPGCLVQPDCRSAKTRHSNRHGLHDRQLCGSDRAADCWCTDLKLWGFSRADVCRKLNCDGLGFDMYGEGGQEEKNQAEAALQGLRWLPGGCDQLRLLSSDSMAVHTAYAAPWPQTGDRSHF
ncbi:riboflavin transporter MCH5 [Fusarium proliferatum]|uniref:Riboflavin transporter MCH5 n=1 Tax=Gibberella intermedia TaxID=948311 RepID=A0A365MR25_GIBIN|nr:riboflavin transporter MCH5 [Fusarium proliferatum]